MSERERPGCVSEDTHACQAACATDTDTDTTCTTTPPQGSCVRFTYPDGAVYQGDWSNNSPNGLGQYATADGCFYKGRFIDGQLWGHATVIRGVGRVYVGEVQNYMACGYGSMREPTGEVYEGEFFQDQPHGHGILTGSNGLKVEGEWRYGRMGGRYVNTGPDGRVFETEYSNGTMNLLTILGRDGEDITDAERYKGMTLGTMYPPEPKRLEEAMLWGIVKGQLELPLSGRLGDIFDLFGTVTTDPLSTSVLYMPDIGPLRLDQFCDSLRSIELHTLNMNSVKNPSALKRELAKDPGIVVCTHETVRARPGTKLHRL
ncbi:hypothetical protein KIPB_013465, partial [Kipferlia bialata]|eukprot:g13465.t1